VTLLFKNLLFTVLVPGTVAVYIPLLIARDWNTASGWRALAGIANLVVGAAIYACCVWGFAQFGRGTPAPIDAPKTLVVRGLYRYSRNPMYLGVLTVIAGWALLYGSGRLLAYAAVVAACFESVVRFYEEPHLEHEFGEPYRRYKRHVRRWI
jgi:protein-S-isoprenylcysteine O-methyltransferase Ste14